MQGVLETLARPSSFSFLRVVLSCCRAFLPLGRGDPPNFNMSSLCSRKTVLVVVLLMVVVLVANSAGASPLPVRMDKGDRLGRSLRDGARYPVVADLLIKPACGRRESWHLLCQSGRLPRP